jgi:hypothetical protein
MPVTARLSLKFYEKLGEDVANELVEWFNSVDATYRSDLRELNELNFARFDAKVEQRIGALNARIDAFEAKVDARFEAFEARMEQRLSQGDARFESFESRLVQRIEARIGSVRHEMLRWMLASWSSMMLVLLGTLFAVLKAR